MEIKIGIKIEIKIKIGNEDKNENEITISSVDSNPSVHSPQILELRSKVRASLEKLSDLVILGEKIKSLFLRETYGTRGKYALLFEDSDPWSIWRWEALR